MMWGYFNSKGQGHFIRMHIILDLMNNWLLKIKICLTLWEFNIGVPRLMHPKEKHLFIYDTLFIHKDNLCP